MNKEKGMVTIPYIAYEKEMSSKNSIIKFLIFTTIVLIISIVLVVGMFMSFINSHDYKNYDQDGNGINNINEGTQRDVINESSTSKDD